MLLGDTERLCYWETLRDCITGKLCYWETPESFLFACSIFHRISCLLYTLLFLRYNCLRVKSMVYQHFRFLLCLCISVVVTVAMSVSRNPYASVCLR